jgi:sporadic carbohydrate cluster 2OG-Fe(II) oxygenase
MFLSEYEHQLSNDFLNQGYVIRPIDDVEKLAWIRKRIVELVEKEIGKKSDSESDILNQIHKQLPVNDLNTFRLKIIQDLYAIKEFREMYFKIARTYLDILVGNELAMQTRVNLSIQIPGDSSSLLPVHADTWSGDSPFEVVVWLPLVDCYGTKAMYLLPPVQSEHLRKDWTLHAEKSSEGLFQYIKDNVVWLKVKFGEVLIFNQALPHGNRINSESETRWSMNCRFKSVFTPYGDKKIGEFFEPITLRASSLLGMQYQLPEEL